LKGIREGGSCDVHISMTDSIFRIRWPEEEGGREGGREGRKENGRSE